MKDEITLIIPTYNREKLVERAINYWQDNNINFFIIDSSENINSKLKNSSNYYHYPNLEFYEKLQKGLSIVTTPYVLIVADDDFVSVNSIIKCINFLKNNNSFVSAQGAYIDFWYDVEGHLDISVRNPSMSGLSSNVLNDNSNERIYKSMNPYTHHIYSVHKIDVLKKSIQICNQVVIESEKNHISKRFTYRMNEYIISIVDAIYGKHKMLPVMYGFRQVTNESDIIFQKNANNYKENFEQWIINPLNKNVNNWIAILADLNFIENQVEINQTIKIIQKTIFSLFSNPTTKLSLFKKTIKKFIPKILLNYYKHPLYYHKIWPPTKDHSRKIRKLSMKDKYYPWNNHESNLEWKKIEKFLFDYGKVEGKSFKLF